MEANAIFGLPARAFPLAEAVQASVPAGESNTVIRLGFPFVSCTGVEALLNGLRGCPDWPGMRKMWLVGLHQGITEPAALDLISALPLSRVRLFLPGGGISARALRSRPMFHAKVVGVETAAHARKPGVLRALIVSSANLTGAAIVDGGANYEAGATLSGFDVAASDRWGAWWATAWAKSVPLTPEIVDHYARLRDAFVRANPVVLDSADPPSSTSLANANTLWIEAGAMSGGSRNQVEFNRELAAFFGPVITRRRKLSVEIGGQQWNDRPLSPKVTTFGVEIWRLSLPTKASGGLKYPGTVIRFRRRMSGVDSFLLDIAAEGSRSARAWRSEANRAGYIGSTSGNRAFGLY
jgi:hypothetical protein